METQFVRNYELSRSITRFYWDHEKLSLILSLMVVLEQDHPGTLDHILNDLTLIADGWEFNSHISPELHDSLYESNQKFLDGLDDIVMSNSDNKP